MSEDLETSLARANNMLATKLYLDLTVDQRYGNVLFSPLCLTLAVGTLAAIAGSSIEQELSALLQLHLDETMLGLIRGYSASIRGSAVRLVLKLFVDSNIEDTDVETFKNAAIPQVGVLDFQEPEKCRDMINEWAAHESEGEITDLMPDGALSTSTMFTLTNGTYCKTNWSKPVFKARTKPRLFEIAEGDSVEVEMMEMEEEMLYGFSDALEAEIIRIHLENPDLSMVIILPEGPLEDIEPRLENLNFDEELGHLVETSVQLRLPKFFEESTRNFKEYLQNMTPSTGSSLPARLSLLSTRGPFTMTSIFQKAVIEVEEGDEPSVLTDSATLKEKPISVFCDHPFIYIILYKKSIHLMGRFFQPTRILKSSKKKSWVKKYWQRVRFSDKKNSWTE